MAGSGNRIRYGYCSRFSHYLVTLLVIFPIIAVIVQPRLPRAGRWLLSVAAPLLSVWIVPIGIMVLVKTVRGEPWPHDFIGVVFELAWTLSPILLIWCNAALVIEAVKERCARRDVPAEPVSAARQ